MWVGPLEGLLESYERKRDQYPTLEAFADELISFFIDQAERVPDLEQVRPRLVAMEPKNGDRAVDPGVTELRLTFDRKMRDRSWGLIGQPADLPANTGEPRYDETRTVLTFPVKLERNKQYHFWLNTTDMTLFRSEEGAGLEPVEVTLATRG